MTAWMTSEGYEYEYNEQGQFTGRYRCIGGRLADGRWPIWDANGHVSYA